MIPLTVFNNVYLAVKNSCVMRKHKQKAKPEVLKAYAAVPAYGLTNFEACVCKVVVIGNCDPNVQLYAFSVVW